MTAKKRANGNGSVFTYKDKYRAQFVTPEGKRASKIFATKQDAEDWLVKQRALVADNDYIEPSEMTLGQWINEYFATYCDHLRPKTKFGHLQTAKHLAPIANIPLQKLSAQFLQKFFNTAQLSEDGKHRTYKFLKQILNKAVTLDMIRKNVLLPVTLPQYVQPEIETFSVDEIQKILATVDQSKYYKKYYPLFLFAIYSGCRVSEILGLKIANVFDDHVHIEETRINVGAQNLSSTPKTDAGKRDITLPPNVITELRKAYQYTQPLLNNGYVFHTAKGTPLQTRNVERTWIAILDLAQLPRKHFHALRHTHATQLLAAGIPILEVSRRLGHSRASHTLNLYGHAIKGYDSKISDKLCAIFDNGCTRGCTQAIKQ